MISAFGVDHGTISKADDDTIKWLFGQKKKHRPIHNTLRRARIEEFKLKRKVSDKMAPVTDKIGSYHSPQRRVLRRVGRGIENQGKSKIAGAVIGAGATVAMGTALGRNVESAAQHDAKQFQNMSRRYVNQAAKDKKYKPVGNNVYAKERKFFQTNSKAYVDQTVKDNKGSKNQIYVRTAYPNGVIGGVTWPHDKKPQAQITAFPGVIPSKKSKLKAQYIATHEHQHAKDLTNNSKWTDTTNEAVRNAKEKYPDKGPVADRITGRSARRYATYKNENRRLTAQYEGRADKAAQAQHNIPARKVTAYPIMANRKVLAGGKQTPFGVGYEEGGGQRRSIPFSSRNRQESKQWREAKRNA